MSDRKHPSTAGDLLLGTALLGQTGQPQGAAPSDSELAAWATGALAGTRAAEVESHLATTPGALPRALALAGAAQDTPRRPASGRLAWLADLLRAPRHVAVAAGLAALAVFGVALIQSAQRPGPAQPPSGTLRGAVATHPDWRVAALRGGYARGDGDSALDAQLAVLDIDQCLDGDACPALAAELMIFGAVLRQLNDTCAQQPPAPGELRTRLLPVAGAAAGSLELAAWSAPINQLLDALGGDGGDVCQVAAGLRQRFVEAR